MSSRLDAHCSCSNFHKPEKVGAFAARPYRQDYSTLSPSKTQSIWLGPRVRLSKQEADGAIIGALAAIQHSAQRRLAVCSLCALRSGGPVAISTGVGGDEVIPAAPTTPRTKPNDIWILGEHRVRVWRRTRCRISASVSSGRVRVSTRLSSGACGVRRKPSRVCYGRGRDERGRVPFLPRSFVWRSSAFARQSAKKSVALIRYFAAQASFGSR